ncbi:MAG: iron-only hydrogenase system regulator [Candidatus Omnitrophica bacterium]|nr:iron-only hydrogenase system regulator [Candidatus Omnitrophota bacterium]MCF7877525.1 iron-only hydrogenase system regulator [Candidatus Omnitrophota bacterium]MCF7891897.1 iron-only hydrogenase system regulator [Candidatus Omnitrophota bacterium]MCF7895433.1 iron-only hydrogenase system regulator [Candidatus Omnitrophota bacterium]MCF7897944.1 iron-only hydrogenase system regulator [Candidatus Omnitrophota bacterium]
MDKRLGFIGIIIENREKSAYQVNEILSDCSNLICARMGLPYRERDCSVITLIVDATTDEIGLITGRLGRLEGVSVKSALSKKVKR